MAGVKRTNRILGVSLGLLLAAVAVVPGPASGARRARSFEIAPGVTFTKIRDTRGPWNIRVVSVVLSEESTLEPVLAKGKLPGFETTSAMAARHGALAAINGDYARATGRPVMLFAQDGELAQTALTRGVNFAVNSTETVTYIKHQKPELWLREAASDAEHPVGAFNAGPPASDMLNGFSALGGRHEKPPREACSARLYANEGPRPAATRPGLEQSHVVNEVVCKSGRLWPRKGRVFSTPMTGTRAHEIVSLTPGDEVEFGWSLSWPDVLETIGGMPTLVRQGELFIGKGNTPFFRRHPRTGVGTTADGRVLFVTVDGRSNKSIGMTPRRFAKLFVELGAEYALNLDGGGSTTMVVNDQVVNRPSDGYERPVSSALVLLPGPDPSPTASPAPAPTPTPTPSPSVTTLPPLTDGTTPSRDEVWLQVVRDPASTGGLADWLRHRGLDLRGSLGRAASLFRLAE